MKRAKKKSCNYVVTLCRSAIAMPMPNQLSNYFHYYLDYTLQSFFDIGIVQFFYKYCSYLSTRTTFFYVEQFNQILWKEKLVSVNPPPPPRAFFPATRRREAKSTNQSCKATQTTERSNATITTVHGSSTIIFWPRVAMLMPSIIIMYIELRTGIFSDY